MIIPYSHMSGFVMSRYKPRYVSLFTRDFTFSFSEYVKCQVHLPTLWETPGRDIMTAYESLGFLEGNLNYEESCIRMLGYFYEDMLEMLKAVLVEKPELPHKISVLVDFRKPPQVKTLSFDLESVRQNLEVILENSSYGEETGPGIGVLANFTASQIGKLKATDMLALAAILTHVLEITKGKLILEVK